MLPQTQGKPACLVLHPVHEGWLRLCILNQYGQLTVPFPQQAPVVDVRRTWDGFKDTLCLLGPRVGWGGVGSPTPVTFTRALAPRAHHELQLQTLTPPSPSPDREPGVALTDDDFPVICNEHLAVDINELRDRVPTQLSMRAKPTDGHVIPPRCPHCRDTREVGEGGV